MPNEYRVAPVADQHTADLTSQYQRASQAVSSGGEIYDLWGSRTRADAIKRLLQRVRVICSAVAPSRRIDVG